MEFSAASDPGIVRAHNEDSFALLPLPRGALLAVADGVGGSRAGEVASAIATRTLTDLLTGREAQLPHASRTLREVLQAAHERIVAAARSGEHSGMGTTMTAAWVQGARLVFAHVGDSRLYVCGANGLRRLTSDHSVAAELVRRGSIPPEEAERHPQRHVLTQALGLTPFACDEGAADLGCGDVVLLCSDGLFAALGEAEIAREIAAGFAGVALRLVEAANRAGGSDNTTVVAARLGDADCLRGDVR